MYTCPTHAADTCIYLYYYYYCSFLHIADVFTKGIWQTVRELQDPELKRLATCLPQTVLASRADSTVTKYLHAFRRWKEWADTQSEISVFPIEVVHFALYLQHLSQSTKSKSAVEEAVNAAGWVNRLSGEPPIGASPFIQATLAGLQRQLAKPRVRKEPVTAAMLAALVGSLGTSPSLTEVRLAAAALLSFAAFLRYDELSKLRCCDLEFSEQSLSVKIRSSKTDQYRQGDTVLVARTQLVTCPVAMVERYIAMASISLSSELRLFRGIVHTKTGERLRASGSLSYTRMRELFLAKLSSLGFDPKQFGLHSLRAGGASAAANAGVPDRLFKRHGRWRSETAKDGYVKDSVPDLLSVSKSLDI